MVFSPSETRDFNYDELSLNNFDNSLITALNTVGVYFEAPIA
jgi:hypothetical protein